MSTGLSEEEKGNVHRDLIIGQHISKSGAFLEAKKRSLDLLERAWLCFVKQDFNSFVRSVIIRMKLFLQCFRAF